MMSTPMKLTINRFTGQEVLEVKRIKGRSKVGEFVVLPRHEPYFVVAQTEYGNGILEVTPKECKLLVFW
jgi:F0F1-type ATP synthase epsilon subunit